MDFKEEIEKLLLQLKKEGYSRRDIEKELGYSENYIDQILSKGGNKKVLGQLTRFHENLLQNATKEIIIEEPNTDYLKKRRDQKNGTKETPIPMYFGNTRAGTIQIYSDDPEMQTPVGHLPANIFPGCNHAEKISGDSMYPLICNQAYLIGKVIDKRGIIWGEKYIIHTKYGQSMVKYVHPSEEKQFIKIVSHNKTIPTQDLPLDDITFVCRVHFIVNPS